MKGGSVPKQTLKQKKTKKKQIIEPDIHFKVLDLIEENPKITQRELSKKLGVSLGSVNFCMKALIDIGHIKVENFKKNPQKLNYLYLLTPQGIGVKSTLMINFLKRKMREYDALKSEIDSINKKLDKEL